MIAIAERDQYLKDESQPFEMVIDSASGKPTKAVKTDAGYVRYDDLKLGELSSGDSQLGENGSSGFSTQKQGLEVNNRPIFELFRDAFAASQEALGLSEAARAAQASAKPSPIPYFLLGGIIFLYFFSKPKRSKL